MDSPEIPTDIQAFLAANIRTVGHMEALALLVEEGGEWSRGVLGARLYVAEDRVAEIVRDLAHAGLFEETADGARLRPSLGEREALVLRATQLYRQRLIPMTNLIHAQGDAGRQIADAFRFRKG